MDDDTGVTQGRLTRAHKQIGTLMPSGASLPGKPGWVVLLGDRLTGWVICATQVAGNKLEKRGIDSSLPGQHTEHLQ